MNSQSGFQNEVDFNLQNQNIVDSDFNIAATAPIKKSWIPPKSVINFGNIEIYFHALGASAYRIEWYSRMTGTSTSFSRLEKKRYLVSKQWASTKTLPEISCEFEKHKAAIVHFVHNVDILKLPQEVIYAAKSYCLALFTKQERLDDIKNPNFPKLRLQGSIGQAVYIKSQSGREVIAFGVLLQILKGKAEVKIIERYALSNPKLIQKFTTCRVYLK